MVSVILSVVSQLQQQKHVALVLSVQYALMTHGERDRKEGYAFITSNAQNILLVCGKIR